MNKILDIVRDKSSMCLKRVFLFAIILASALSVFAMENGENRKTPVVRAVSKVLPSVVNLDSKGNRNVPGHEKFQSLGSGIIIDQSGLILTNYHVTGNARSISVTLWNGEKLDAELAACDHIHDLALVRLKKIPSKFKLNPIKTAQPGDLLLGETVIVVGNPYGLGSSISVGIISATGRKIVSNGKIVFSDIIQTDASIYPGNSGGPLINITGKMIGINTAVHKEAPGIGFAIPVERVENVLARWLIPERFENASLGFVPGVKKLNGHPEIFISSVTKNSPAWKAGMRGGEKITGLNGFPVENLLSFSRKLFRLKKGDEISLTTSSGKEIKIKLAPYKHPDGVKLAKERLGLEFEKLTPEIAKALGYKDSSGGMIVCGQIDEVPEIKRGYILTEIDGTPVKGPSSLINALRDRAPGEILKAIFYIPEKNTFRKETIDLVVL